MVHLSQLHAVCAARSWLAEAAALRFLPVVRSHQPGNLLQCTASCWPAALAFAYCVLARRSCAVGCILAASLHVTTAQGFFRPPTVWCCCRRSFMAPCSRLGCLPSAKSAPLCVSKAFPLALSCSALSLHMFLCLCLQLCAGAARLYQWHAAPAARDAARAVANAAAECNNRQLVGSISVNSMQMLSPWAPACKQLLHVSNEVPMATTQGRQHEAFGTARSKSWGRSGPGGSHATASRWVWSRHAFHVETMVLVHLSLQQGHEAKACVKGKNSILHFEKLCKASWTFRYEHLFWLLSILQ